MHMFSSRSRPQPRHGRSSKERSPALPPRRRWDDYDDQYTYSSPWYRPQELNTFPSTPPPPYDDGDEYRYTPRMSSTSLYQQLAQSQQDLPAQKEKRLKKKASGWTPAKELGKVVQQSAKSPYQQEYGSKSSAQLVTRGNRSRRDDCAVVNSLVHGSALCDRVTAVVYEALQEAFSRLEREGGSDELVEATRNMAIGERDLEIAKAGGIVDFKKTWMYSNSRLPPHMPPVKLYLPTWSLVCSAAQASMDVYRRPRKDEKQDYIDADWRAGTKAMIMNSKPMDDQNLIVIAIRGSKWNIVDWAVNFHPSPTAPEGFLDDEGNACHAGFLRVARAMVAPIAARLRDLLEQDPSRAASSLLFTGHSAGGAVASLMYMHMIASSVESELNMLLGCFKRVHCITFGTPPLTFLPLTSPGGKRFERNVFMSFASEGDPIVRADRQYISTLTKIIAAPAPVSGSGASSGAPFKWNVPPATLSNAGRLVLLRKKPGHARAVEAVAVTDEELRDVVFGDPDMHQMELYKQRIDELAFSAVTGRPG